MDICSQILGRYCMQCSLEPVQSLDSGASIPQGGSNFATTSISEKSPAASVGPLDSK